MKKKIIPLMIGLLFSLILANCNYLMRNDSQEMNTETNLDNAIIDFPGSNYLPINEMIYFIHPIEKKLYRMNFDGSNMEEIILGKDIGDLGWLSNDSSYLYGASYGKLYKISLFNPSQVQILRDSGVYGPILHDNKIYYTDFLNDNFNLFRMETDGSNVELIIDDVVASPVIYKSWIYYRKVKDNHEFYRIELDGSNKTKLNNVRAWGPVFNNNEVFFMNNSDSGRLYRMDLETLTMEKLSEVKFTRPIFILNSWLYLIQQGIGSNKMLRFKIDSKETKSFEMVFNPDPEGIINAYLRDSFLIVGTSSFAETIENRFKVYKISFDGAIIEKIIP